MRNNRWLIWWARLSRSDGLRGGLLLGGAVLGLLLGLVFIFSGRQYKSVPLLVAKDSFSPVRASAWQQALECSELDSLLPDNYFSTLPVEPVISRARETGSPLSVFTTIDAALQFSLLKMLKRYQPQIGAGVLLDLRSGAIVAMAHYRHEDENGSILPQESVNLCLDASFPAASLFKIVTAYGVLERDGVTRHTVFPVVGRPHTLYKYQLGLGKSRYRCQSTEISLEKAFARSVNPVFGKLGIDYFPDHELLELAEVFDFNRPLNFDLSVAASVVQASDTAFRRAETASGFINTTTLSPLHAALIAGAPLAPGALQQPFVINRVLSGDGAELFYHQDCPAEFQLVDKKACAELVAMMRATVKYGTASKSFRHIKRKIASRGWDVGGKTGTLDMAGCDRRCEWFAGFGRNLKTDCALAVALVLVHGEKRTISSSYIAAEMLAQALAAH
ncbi:MAG: hypothetical protein JXR80_05560 [Deltaproteobacteria bacterium]|nr:hypothetical protein [Deltaproteobacteria bacterium]